MATKTKRTIRFTKRDVRLLNALDDSHKNAGFHCLFSPKMNVHGRNYVRYDKNARHEVSLINGNRNWYISLNTFRTWKRREDNVIGLNAIWVDVDCEKNGVNKGEFLADLLAQINLLGTMPKPTIITDSGHGYYVIYLFDHQIINNNPCMLRMWSKLERDLVDRLNKFTKKDFGKALGDMNATDSSRVLRVPDSYNLKATPRRCEVVAFNKNVRPNMFDLVNKYLPKKHYKKPNKPKIKRFKAFKKGMQTITGNKSLRSLKWLRVADLLTWLKFHHDSIKGYREEFLFLYACSEIYIEGSKGTVNDVKRINAHLAEPLPKCEIRKLVTEITHIDIRKYHYKNATIIAKLDISPKIQKHLKVLINPAEKYRRQKKSRLKVSCKRKTKKAIRNEKIKASHKSGMSIRKIAKQFGINSSTVQRCLKK